MNTQLTKVAAATLACFMLYGCGGSSSETEVKEPPVVVPPVVENGVAVSLEQAIEHINITAPTLYYVDVTENTPTLTISFARGLAATSLGDPDVYVRYAEEPILGDNASFDCLSYNGVGESEVCMIDQPQIGRYYILVDAFDQGDGVGVSDGTLWASTRLFNNSKQCDEPVIIRGQQLSDEELVSACAVIAETKLRFDTVLNEAIAPEFQVAVENDLNELTFISIFANLTNHKAWVSYLFDSDNQSGIYFETSPTDFYHNSQILTFNGLEWTDGRSVLRSLDHEYVHALDGRYNKEGGYRADMGWWSEGLAEYVGTFYNKPYQRFEISVLNIKYTLAEIFEQHNNNGTPSPYDWGQLAVAFLIEKHPSDVSAMLTHMRAGAWDEYKALLNTFVANYELDFIDYYTSDIRSQFETSAIPLALDSFVKVEGRGGWVYSVEVPTGETSLTIATTGGSGDVALMIDKNTVPHWANEIQPICDTYNEGNAGNEESCTFTDVSAGTYYAVIDSDFVGSDIIDMYLTACTGIDCHIEVPEQKPIVTAAAPVLPVSVPLPTMGEIGSCALKTAYYDSTDIPAEGFSVTNPTDVPVNLFWINTQGEPYLDNNYATLVSGESYNADYWKQGDRMMITDQYNSCIGVVVLNNEDNEFTIDEELVADFVVLPAPQIGRCDLLVPYSRTDNAASNFSVLNTTDTAITLHWVSNTSGEMSLGSDYGTLANGDSYSADYWKEGDRMALVDNESNCLGVLELSAANNGFTIDASLFE